MSENAAAASSDAPALPPPAPDRRRVRILAGILGGLVFLLAAAPVALQNRIVYHPERYPFPEPGKGRAKEFREYRTRDGRVQWGALLPPGDPPGGEAPFPRFHLVFGGNGSTAYGLVPFCRELAERTGCGFFLVDYRGYGFNPGEPTEEGLLHDGIGAYDTLASEGFFEEGVGVIGHSLGGAVAIAVADARPVDTLATYSTFASIPEVAEDLIPVPVGFLLRNEWPSERRVGAIAARPPEARPLDIVFFHAELDRLILPRHGERLAAAAPGLAELVVVSGVGHGRIHLDALDATVDFLSETRSPRRPAGQ